MKLVGEKFGRYQIVEKIWQGATSTVFKAQTNDGTRPEDFVAIKVLHPYRKLAVQRKQFVREAKIMLRLNHPNTVKVYGIGRKDNLLGIFMEFVDGRSLRQHLGEKDFTVPELTGIFLELAKALVYIHECGIVHRDVKPENILLSYNLKEVKLTDFGYAEFLNRRWWQGRSLLNGGTEKYMAPEHKTGLRDERTDVYSFGVMLEELLLPKVFEEKKEEALRNIIYRATHASLTYRYPNMYPLLQDFEPLAASLL